MQQNQKTETKRQPLKEEKRDAYTVIRKDIVELRLRPGMIASIRDLSDHFQISRSPMRDALIRLGQDGLIDFLPQRGIMISKIDLKRVEEERFLRISVEKNVMQAYLSQYTPKDAEFLKELIQKQEESIQEKDFRKNIALDDEFHRFFYTATGNPFCAKVIWTVSGHYNRVRLLTCVDQKIVQEITQQHLQILSAVQNGDAKTLWSIFDHHLGKIGREEIVLTEKYPDLFLQACPHKRENDLLKVDFLNTLRS